MSTSAALLEAVRALYHGSAPQSKESANAWLETWQASPEAWQTSHEVLHAREAGLEAHYLCAQTLRSKIQRDLDELSPAAITGLRDSLAGLLALHHSSPRPVRTQLCLGLGALAAHLPPQDWGPGGVLAWLTGRVLGERLGGVFLAQAQRLEAGAPAAQLAAQLVPALAQQGSDSGSLTLLLELLTLLPQEASAFQSALHPARRRAFPEELVGALDLALGLLQLCWLLNQPALRPCVLEAAAAWLRLLGSREGWGVSQLARAGALHEAVLGALREPDCFHAACDAAVELVYCASQRGRPRPELAGVVARVVAAAAALGPRFAVCAAEARRAAAEEGPEAAGEGEEAEEAKALARLFAEIGEAFTDAIAEAGPEAQAPVQALLDVAAHPYEPIACTAANFWHRLARALASGLGPEPISGAADASSAPPSPGTRERRLAAFGPAFARLARLVLERTRFPEAFDDWHRDERREFKRARVAWSDSLLDAATVLGGEAALRLVCEPLLATAAPPGWREAEASLYCVRALHRSPPPAGSAFVLALFEALPGLQGPGTLRYTRALTVGAWADWLAGSGGSQERGAQASAPLLRSLLDMLVADLADPATASAAALSVRRLCDGAGALLGACAPPLVGLYAQIQSAGEAAGKAAPASPAKAPAPAGPPALDEEDVQQLMEAVVLVVGGLAPEERSRCMRHMLDLVVQPLQVLLNERRGRAEGAQRAEDDPARDALILVLLDRVACLFRAAKDPQDVADALPRLWPWLDAALDAFEGDAAAVERVCRVPRYGLRASGAEGAASVPLLLASLPARFARRPEPPFLYVVSEVVKTWGPSAAHAAQVGQLFAAMMAQALEKLPGTRAMAAAPDLADDAFLLAGRALSYAPYAVYVEGLLEALLRAASAGLLLQHREACCSAVALLVRLFDPATARRAGVGAAPALGRALEARGQALANVLLAAVGGASPSARVAELSDAVYALVKGGGPPALGWLERAVAALPDAVAGAQDRARFLGACAAAARDQVSAADERLVLGAVEELADLARRSRRAQAAAQEALLPAQLREMLGC